MAEHEVESESNVQIVNPPAVFKSAVWKTFGFLKGDNKKVVCRECKQILPYSGNTTNMSTHLRRHHGIQLQLRDNNNNNRPKTVAQVQSSNTVLGNISENQTKMDYFRIVKLSGEKKEMINTAIMNFIIQDLRPF